MGITLTIIFFVLFLAAMLVIGMFGAGFLHDPSIIDNGWLRAFLEVFFPFELATTIFMSFFQENDTRLDINSETMEYTVVPQLHMGFMDFFRTKTFSARLSSETYEVNLGMKVLWLILLAILLFVAAWFLGEWIPGEASACRPPWKLLRKSYFDSWDQGYTVGANEERKRRDFQKRVEHGKSGRHELS